MAYLLIVDDDLDFAQAIAASLAKEGHETAIETDTEGVRGQLRRRMPDVLILDVMFPENPCTGFELAREIGKVHRNLPILLLTAVNDQFPLGFSDKDIDSRWLPVAGFLEKPVDLQVLKEKVRQLLAPVAR